MEKKRNLEDIDCEVFKVYIDGEFYRELPYSIVRHIEKTKMAKFSKEAKRKIKELREEYKMIFYSMKHKRVEQDGTRC